VRGYYKRRRGDLGLGGGINECGVRFGVRG
jgi:hypothetical protein